MVKYTALQQLIQCKVMKKITYGKRLRGMLFLLFFYTV